MTTRKRKINHDFVDPLLTKLHPISRFGRARNETNFDEKFHYERQKRIKYKIEFLHFLQFISHSVHKRYLHWPLLKNIASFVYGDSG
jgi:hypothetical protein